MPVRRNYRINLRNYGNPPAVMVSQYDENYDLVFEVFDGVVPATGLNAYTVKLVGRQPGNDPALKYEFTGTVSGIANNILSFTIDTTMTGRAGKGTAEIVILDTTNDVKFASFNLPVYVEKAAVPDDAIDANVERAQEIADEVQDIVDTAAAEVKGEAESWAVGERDGEPVPSTDPTYHNNAKYYAEQAQDIADSIGIDATLSISGKAADAKKTGDEISSLKEDLNDFQSSFDHSVLFVDDYLPVKELYITKEGRERGITYLHYIYAEGTGKGRIRFSNGTSFTGEALAVENGELYYGVSKVTDESGNGNYGYIIFDWSLVSGNGGVVKQILDSAYIPDYSPSIQTYIQKVEVSPVKIKKMSEDIYGGAGFVDLTESYLSVSNINNIWFMYNNNIPHVVNRIEYLSKDGTINFYKITYVDGASSLSYELITSVLNTENGVIKTVDFDDVIVDKNTYIGVNGAFCFKVSNDYTTRSYAIASGTISNKGNQVLAFNAINKDAAFVQIDEIKKEISGDGKAPDLSRNGEVVLYNELLASNNSDIIGTQTFDANGNGLIVDGQKILNKYYSVSDRTIRIVCKFASNTVAKLGTAKKSGLTYTSETPILVDVVNKTVKVSNLNAVPFSILNSTDEFLISVTKHYQDLAVEIRDIYTGEQQEYIFITNGTGGKGQGAIGTATIAGMQYDYYQFDLASGGSYTIKQIVIICATCDLLIYGDSITEPEAYWPTNLFNLSWTQLVRAKMKGRALTSGRGGTLLTQINERIVNELPLIKPKYCMVTIGTNGAPTQAALTALVEYILSQNVIPVLNHIPCYNNNGDTTGFIAYNQVIDAVRADKGINGCDFDLATSVDHDGLAVDTSTMWLETAGSGSSATLYYHHPNVKGSANMFDRLLIDVPEIFN